MMRKESAVDPIKSLSLQDAQSRIDLALRESVQDRMQSSYSDYLPENASLAQKLMLAAARGGLQGIHAALDQFDRLSTSEDRLRLQKALLVFLTHWPEAAKLGLRIPGLEKRSPWKVVPSQRHPKQ